LNFEDRTVSAKAFMLQGTGSSVGKSLIVAALCRAFANRGLNVRPFKPQNMSNNAAVTDDGPDQDGGGEIGRAQALQALGARVPLSVHMNPILLKPQTETGAQIVVQGKVWGQAKARDFQAIKPQLLPAVLESFETLKSQADLVLVEGAGSASEINLRSHDIANMGFARAADVPVCVIGDIDRGGVIASLVGTHTVLPEEDRAMITGFMVNRMRGDLSLFDDGMAEIARYTGWRNLGLVPHFDDAHLLPSEDAMELAERASGDTTAAVHIVVPALPRIANFDDLDPLRAEPSVRLTIVPRGAPLPACDLVILPGSKATIADLAALRAEGWDMDLRVHVRRGGHVLGLCGGYQMLGRTLADPDGTEGPVQTVEGLGLLEIDTVLAGDKALTHVTGQTITDGVSCSGYEMHIGKTEGPDRSRPFVELVDGRSDGRSYCRTDGASSPDGRIVGTYLHGIFMDTAQREAWLKRLGTGGSATDYRALQDDILERLAAHLEQHADLDAILELAR
jgi:adenosylcobyric acid synthase